MHVLARLLLSFASFVQMVFGCVFGCLVFQSPHVEPLNPLRTTNVCRWCSRRAYRAHSRRGEQLRRKTLELLRPDVVSRVRSNPGPRYCMVFHCLHTDCPPTGSPRAPTFIRKEKGASTLSVQHRVLEERTCGSQPQGFSNSQERWSAHPKYSLPVPPQ